MFVIRQFHCTSHAQCSCCIRADPGTYVPVAFACSFTRLRIVCKGYLGGHMPALKCKSCLDKHGLHVLLLDSAWYTSFGMYITCLLHVKAVRNNMDCTLSYHCAWCASHCQEQHGLYALLPLCLVCQPLPGTTWTVRSPTTVPGVPATV